jgi:ribosomal protein S18 acetylase RimI-like enzyme/catechol 2,3-dioxygenase-like lactoylglutathione lyase family enzyme
VIRIGEIDHLVLRVVDLARMVEFYRGALGCEVVREDLAIGLIQLRAGKSLIDLIPVTGALGRVGGAAPGPEGRNLEHFCLTVTPFHEPTLRAHFTSLGFAVGEEGSRFGAEGEGPSVYVEDPEGNTIELKGPPWPLREDPRVIAHRQEQAREPAAPYPPSAAPIPDPKSAPIAARRLAQGDAPAYAALRLRMLTEHPEAYGSSAEEEGALSLTQFAARLDPGEGLSPRLSFGVFDGQGVLGATASVLFDQRKKESHRAHVVAVYVLPSWRGRGAGRLVLSACVDAARARPEVDMVLLRVTASNSRARRLYESYGFRTFGIEPRSLRLDGVSYDTALMALDLQDSDPGPKETLHQGDRLP